LEALTRTEQPVTARSKKCPPLEANSINFVDREVLNVSGGQGRNRTAAAGLFKEPLTESPNWLELKWISMGTKELMAQVI